MVYRSHSDTRVIRSDITPFDAAPLLTKNYTLTTTTMNNLNTILSMPADVIADLPTLEQGHDADLIHEETTARVWRSRVEHNLLEVETVDSNGAWTVTATVHPHVA